MTRNLKLVFCCTLVAGALLVCATSYLPAAQTPAEKSVVLPIGKPVQIKAPLGLPPVPVPADNPLTEETIALGRRLYYDPQLSVDSTVSCASCHAPEFAFSDNRSFSVGVSGKLGARKAPTVINSAYNPLQFWDGRAPSLEEQAKGPMANPVEMAHSLEGVVQHLQADPKYPQLFKNAWGTDQITIDLVVKSIASFERTIIAGDSPFDRFYYGHDSKALTPAAQRGLKIFVSKNKGNCEVCHTIGKDYALFTDGKFHNLGIGADTRGNLSTISAATTPPRSKPTKAASKRLPSAISPIAAHTCTTARSVPSKTRSPTISAAAIGILTSTRKFTRSIRSPSTSATTCSNSSIPLTASSPITLARRPTSLLRQRTLPPADNASAAKARGLESIEARLHFVSLNLTPYLHLRAAAYLPSTRNSLVASRISRSAASNCSSCVASTSRKN